MGDLMTHKVWKAVIWAFLLTVCSRVMYINKTVWVICKQRPFSSKQLWDVCIYQGTDPEFVFRGNEIFKWSGGIWFFKTLFLQHFGCSIKTHIFRIFFLLNMCFYIKFALGSDRIKRTETHVVRTLNLTGNLITFLLPKKKTYILVRPYHNSFITIWTSDFSPLASAAKQQT